MSKKKNEKMYVVQPKTSPPQSTMQSQFRIVVSDDGKKNVKEDTSSIRVVSSEKIQTDRQGNWMESEEHQEEWDRVVEISTGISSDG